MRTDLKKRKFLKTSAFVSMVPFLGQFIPVGSLFAKDITSGIVKNGTVLTGAHWGMLKLTIENGKIIKSEPYEKKAKMDNPLQFNTADMVYKSRVKYPYVRKSYLENPDSPKPELRGKDEWVRVKYEDAIKLIANELKKTRKGKGNQSIFGGSYGWKSSGNVHNSRILLHRFLNITGGFVGSLGDYSTGATQVIMPHVMGSIEVYEQQTSWDVVLENSKVIVIWGADPVATLRIAWTVTDGGGLEYFEKLKASGKKIIYIDPIRNETAKFLGDVRWISPIPNTDVALMMGMASHLLDVGKVDNEFLNNYTVGFDKFKDYLVGKDDGVKKDVAWASKISGVDEATIKELAELFFDNRTMFMSGWGMQRAHHGEQPHWMLVTLCSMLGQIGLPGGGFGLSYHYSNGGVPTCKGSVIGGVNSASVGQFDKNGKFLGFEKNNKDGDSAGQSWLEKATDYAFPVARIADALANPGKVIDHDGSKITYPKIDFVYWVGGNPIVHHQDTNNFRKALKNTRTFVVHEPYWTPTAKMADIVMPVTTSYERDDISMSGDYSNMHIVPMKQAVDKFEESKDDYEIFCDLSKAYADGVYEAYSEGGKKPIDFIKEYYEAAKNQFNAMSEEIGYSMKNFDDFWKENKPVEFFATPESIAWVRYGDFREDPILNALGTPSGLIEIYSETIEKMGYDDCKAHPTWFEPIEWLGMKNKPAEFHLVTSHPRDRLHSQQNHTSLREVYAVKNREPIWINTKDAQAKGIKDGDLVRVFNQRGEILTGAVVTDDIMQGVVRVCEGAWYDPKDGEIGAICQNGSANVLTIDIPTSKLANGNISHTGLVNIEKYNVDLPLNAFDAPKGAEK